MMNGTPMGPGFFILFNNLDVSQPFKGYRRIHEFEEDNDKEVLDLITIVFSFLERE